MQAFEWSQMAFATINLSKWLIRNIDLNQIGIKGCEYLSTANWAQLQKLDLSITEIIKSLIQLEMKDVHFWVNQNGPIWTT